MNLWGAVILTALIGDFLVGLTVDLLNVRSLSDGPPPELAHLVEAKEYARTRRYVRARTALSRTASGARLVALLLFWFAGGFGILDGAARWLAASVGLGEIGAGLAFIGALVAGTALLSLPFRVYSTFVLEERFGFNRTTPGTFALDLTKGVGLALALGGPLLALVLWFFAETGPWGWVYAWASVTAFGLALQYLGPRYILPLFNDLAPVEDEQLRRSILEYVDSVAFPVDEIYVMDASRRTEKTNALFAGFGSNRRVVLFDTLVRRHSPAEIVAIVAHEVGHYVRRHVPLGMVLGAIHAAALFLLLSIVLRADGLYPPFHVDRPSVHAGIVFFSLLYTPVETALAVPLNWLSRRFEFQADRFAADTTGATEALLSALEKLSVHNRTNLNPHPAHVALRHSHPPLRDRVRALRRRADPDPRADGSSPDPGSIDHGPRSPSAPPTVG